ncbi:MAG: 4-hydroxythreonine-4-phosphate dehydrogenase PdxA [Pseudobdellovibrionaceae bacterium]
MKKENHKQFNLLAITTGDVDGIGFEITTKSLLDLGPQNKTIFLLFRGPNASKKYLSLLDKKFNRIEFKDVFLALDYFSNVPLKSNIILDIVSDLSPALWVEGAAQLAMTSKISAIVTGPLSKTEIYKSGLKDMGHTGILKRISKTKNVFMGFIGAHFNVVLATDHIPLRQVSAAITLQRLKDVIKISSEFFSQTSSKSKPMALLGLNPHSGEYGLIGSEEKNLLRNLKKFGQKENINLDAFLVPDAAFLPQNWKKFLCYIALYHDQGLIPFKSIHGQDGVHVSLGLPFIRTSVDHGTAKELFERNIASHQSMLLAIQCAIKLLKNS